MNISVKENILGTIPASKNMYISVTYMSCLLWLQTEIIIQQMFSNSYLIISTDNLAISLWWVVDFW